MISVLNDHKKKFLLFILCVLSYSAYCQDQDFSKCHPCLDRCEILGNLLKDSTIERWYHLKKFQDTPIVIVDISKSFVNCNLGNINGRVTKIVTDSSLMKQINNSNIIVNFYPNGKRKYRVELLRKKNNSFFWINLKERNGRFFSLDAGSGIVD
ncbi:hypothetical protein SAMN05518672_1011328 [Chitinophaga sp. CF118]|nr:hypothetical protein SAMN05518672_1011328 [Chitinophaga sp. CF118]